MSKLYWVHQDCLNAAWIEPGAEAVWVFDDEQIEAEGWTLKRLVFFYECLMELPVRILRGPTAGTLLDAARGCGADTIVTVRSPDAFFESRCATLAAQIRVELLDPPQFVALPDSVDLKRFSRYWKKAEPLLFQ